MSTKLDMSEIVSGHFSTMRKANGKLSLTDIVVFWIVPIVFAVAGVVLGFDFDKETISLLVNFGSIFTALLLSVLVLVYDQESKLDGRNLSDLVARKKKILLDQLYYNISFAVVSALSLIVFCLMWSVLPSEAFLKNCIVMPLIVSVLVNLIFTILMIVKRMHIMLTTQ